MSAATTTTTSNPGMPSLRLEDNPDLSYIIGLTLAKAQNSTPADRATKRRTRENEISIARIFANEQIVLVNDVLGMIGQREDSPTVCKLRKTLGMLRTIVDVASLAVKSERLARMTEGDIIVEQNIAIFHIYSYLYNINLLRKNTRIKAADEWTTMTAGCDPKDEGLEDRRQAYVRNLKKLAEKLSRKWKKQIRQMRVKAFHEKIVLVSKQLPRTAPPAKRPRTELEVPRDSDVLTKALDISPIMPEQPTMVTATFLPFLPTPTPTAAAAAASPAQDSTDQKKRKRTQDPAKKRQLNWVTCEPGRLSQRAQHRVW